jgi:hypothetical protein
MFSAIISVKRLSEPQGLVWLEGLVKLKKLIHLIVSNSRLSDLERSAWITMLPRAPKNNT